MKAPYSLALASAFLLAGNAFSFPVSMDIGAYAIDDYLANGGGKFNLSYMIAGGQNFFWAAQATIPGYAAGQTNNPTLSVDARNTQVTKAAITNATGAGGTREYNDFVYYGGHGVAGAFYLGASDPPYGQVSPASLNLGNAYNRWLLTNSCSLFNGGAPATVWQPAFKGLKAMLGFKSFVFDNNLAWDLYYDFWANWTYREKSLLNSFFDAQANYGYKHLQPSKGLEPGCLSAQVPADRIDYCRETFKVVNHDYAKATANTGYYYFRKIGNPQY